MPLGFMGSNLYCPGGTVTTGREDGGRAPGATTPLVGASVATLGAVPKSPDGGMVEFVSPLICVAERPSVGLAVEPGRREGLYSVVELAALATKSNIVNIRASWSYAGDVHSHLVG